MNPHPLNLGGDEPHDQAIARLARECREAFLKQVAFHKAEVTKLILLLCLPETKGMQGAMLALIDCHQALASKFTGHSEAIGKAATGSTSNGTP